MTNLDPQLAAEFAALEKLRLAVLQYRDEVIGLRKSRGLSPLTDIPRVDLEVPEELQAIANGVTLAPPVVLVAPPVVPIPVPVQVPAVPAISAMKEAASAADPIEQAKQPEERIRTSPFAPIPAPTPAFASPTPTLRAETPPLIPAVRVEPGLAMRAEPIALRTPEVAPALQPQAPPRVEARAIDTPRTPTPVSISPVIPNRRPGMSQSMQMETVGSFLRRFRLAAE